MSVARTKNGGASLYVVPAAVTWRLGHRLEQGRLRLRRGAIDLVGEQHVREHRPAREDELALAVLLEQHARAGDVGRHQVDGELDAVEAQVQRLPERAHDQRLAGTRHALDEHVPAGEQAMRISSITSALADDRLAPARLRMLGEGLAEVVDACACRSGIERHARRWRAVARRLSSAARQARRGARRRPAAADRSRADLGEAIAHSSRVKIRRTIASCCGATSAFCSGASATCSSASGGRLPVAGCAGHRLRPIGGGGAAARPGSAPSQ